MRKNKTKSKSQPPASPLANPTAVRIMAALAGGSRQLAEIAQVSYNKINTLIRASTGNADFLYEVYRSLDSHPDFRKTLESTWSILDALREMGKITPVSVMEMDEVDARVFDNLHKPQEPDEEDQPLDFPGLPEEEKEETQPDQARSESQDSSPAQAHPEQPTTPRDQAHLPLAASHPNPAVRAFFRKPVDKARGTRYGSSIIDDMFTDKENDNETPIVQSETTGDVMSVITRNPGGATTAITDPFESNLRQMPDQFDSDNKRF